MIMKSPRVLDFEGLSAPILLGGWIGGTAKMVVQFLPALLILFNRVVTFCLVLMFPYDMGMKFGELALVSWWRFP